MSQGYFSMAETDEVRSAQERLGSRAAVARRARTQGSSTDPEPRDRLTAAEQEFVGRVRVQRDLDARTPEAVLEEELQRR